jgi:mono/diheme cytochrome c family protein
VKPVLLTVIVLALLGVVTVFAFVKRTGLSARAQPGRVETAVARRIRALAVPAEYRDRRNPVSADSESIREGMTHFADHCASCHGNDGSGQTDMGKGLFPPAPDMRQAATQDLTDGTLFYVIEHGIRFTGMPAWGTGSADDEKTSWHLVNFIRHLPALTGRELEEMAAMNPRPPAEVRQEIEEERFLSGEDPALGVR